MNAFKNLVTSIFSKPPSDKDTLTSAPPLSICPSQAVFNAEFERETPRSRHRTETPRTKVEAWRKHTIPAPSICSDSAAVSSRTRKRCSRYVDDQLTELESIGSRKKYKTDKTKHEFDKLSMASLALQADVPMASIEKTVSPAPSLLERLSAWRQQSSLSSELDTDYFAAQGVGKMTEDIVGGEDEDGDNIRGSSTEENEDEKDDMQDEEDEESNEDTECDEEEDTMDVDDTSPPASEDLEGVVADSSRSISPSSSNLDLVSEVLPDESDNNKTYYTPPPPKYRSQPPPKTAEIPGLRASRLAAAAALHNQGWPKHCVDLFTKLQLRGLEPTLQHFLSKDFGVLPAAIFTNPATDPTGAAAHIKPAGVLTGELATQAAFHHVRALEWLIKAGQRIRGCADGSTSNGGEHWQRFAADMYRRWALEDAGILTSRMKRGGVPHNLALVELKTRAAHTAASMDAATLAALEKLEGEWEERLGEGVRVPPLYALVMTGTMVAVIALRQVGDEDGDQAQRGIVDVEGSRLRPVATFDWRDGMMDVWNAFAVAITVVHCRDLLIETLIWNVLKPVDGPQGAFTVGAQVGGRYKEDDPDA